MLPLVYLIAFQILVMSGEARNASNAKNCGCTATTAAQVRSLEKETEAAEAVAGCGLQRSGTSGGRWQ